MNLNGVLKFNNDFRVLGFLTSTEDTEGITDCLVDRVLYDMVPSLTLDLIDSMLHCDLADTLEHWVPLDEYDVFDAILVFDGVFRMFP